MASPVLIRNSLSWERTEWVQANTHWLQVTVPPMGYKVYDVGTTTLSEPGSLLATQDRLENDILRVAFAEDGSITSIFDKDLEREVLAEGQVANRLAVYADSGDAWDKENRDYDIKTDVGLAIQDSDCDFRVSYTKKSEDLSDEGVWMLRVNRPF